MYTFSRRYECEKIAYYRDLKTYNNSSSNNNNNNALYLKVPFKALKDTAHKNNSATNRRQFSAHEDK